VAEDEETLNLIQRAQRWIEEALEGAQRSRSAAIAVGSLGFVATGEKRPWRPARHRDVMEADETFTLREPAEAYAGQFSGEIEALRTILLDESVEDART
jgi:hypothetical protein